ncbi:Nucleotidyltransferase domain-containing protein [Oribacterium sp. KHPX15]|nr:Nucleotidyltransferase domain-containing protein [Oribacterium sp. KHPX15]
MYLDMCKLITKRIKNRNIHIADIKEDYIDNIISSADLCDQINRIILFGSAAEDRCTEQSDIDIAVFGSQTKSRMYASKGYKAFIQAVVSYGGAQDYDILYFDDRKTYSGGIMSDIQKGEVLYSRG